MWATSRLRHDWSGVQKWETRQDLNFSALFFSFFTNSFCCFFMWTTECNSVNVFQGRLFENDHERYACLKHTQSLNTALGLYTLCEMGLIKPWSQSESDNPISVFRYVWWCDECLLKYRKKIQTEKCHQLASAEWITAWQTTNFYKPVLKSLQN